MKLVRMRVRGGAFIYFVLFVLIFALSLFTAFLSSFTQTEDKKNNRAKMG